MMFCGYSGARRRKELSLNENSGSNVMLWWCVPLGDVLGEVCRRSIRSRLLSLETGLALPPPSHPLSLEVGGGFVSSRRNDFFFVNLFGALVGGPKTWGASVAALAGRWAPWATHPARLRGRLGLSAPLPPPPCLPGIPPWPSAEAVHEGPDAQLPGQEGGGLRAHEEGPQAPRLSLRARGSRTRGAPHRRGREVRAQAQREGVCGRVTRRMSRACSQIHGRVGSS